MHTTNIGVVLAGIPPQQQEVAEALTAALKKRVSGRVCVIAGMNTAASAQETVAAIIKSLETCGVIPELPADEPVYTEAEEEKIRKRLEGLGYL
jgi:hypothetical protein